MTGERDVLDIAGVAEVLGVSPGTVRGYRHRGYLPDEDGVAGGSPWWYRGTITAWDARRPGRGSGAGGPARWEVTFTVPRLLQGELTDRGAAGARERSRLVARDLTRYYALLRVSLPVFTPMEAEVLIHALNGVLLTDVYGPQGVVALEVHDLLEGDDVPGWGREQATEFVSRLAGLSVCEEQAVIDAVEKWWSSPQATPVEDSSLCRGHRDAV